MGKKISIEDFSQYIKSEINIEKLSEVDTTFKNFKFLDRLNLCLGSKENFSKEGAKGKFLSLMKTGFLGPADADQLISQL
ncbi:MAG: hypothetical protein GY828_04160, partial [Candidatus Gracilibacteria bacterium]|nr:hypothetical protein [Candidatus Gracilibacteria bacterium]